MPIKPISIVVKLIWAMGRFLAKISDNRHKATGPRDRVEHLIQLTHFEEREENNLAVVV
jgi:nicotinic acid phosphoribosyltransferase